MKKNVMFVSAIVLAMTFTACGPSEDEKAKMEKDMTESLDKMFDESMKELDEDVKEVESESTTEDTKSKTSSSTTKKPAETVKEVVVKEIDKEVNKLTGTGKKTVGDSKAIDTEVKSVDGKKQ